MTEKEMIECAVRKATKEIKADDCKMEKIKSNLFGIEVDVRNVNGDYLEITHDNLEKIYLAHKNEFRVIYKPIVTEMDHAVVECSITYNDTCVTKVGEASKGNLKNSVLWNIPVSTAYMRAFDRAMIRMLDFDKLVYSTMEISMSSYYKGQISKLEYQLSIIDKEVLEIAKTVAEEIKNTYVNKSSEIITISDEGEIETKQTKNSIFDMGEAQIEKVKAKPSKKSIFNIEEEPEVAVLKKNPVFDMEEAQTEEIEVWKPTADTVLLVGNCKGMRLGDAVKSPKWPSFLSWIKNIDYKTNNPEVKQQADYFKEYARRTK